MSVRALSWAFKLPVKPSARKFVLLVLADYSNDTGKTSPAMKTIRLATMLSEDAVNIQIAGLIEDGIISDTKEKSGDAAIYQLHPVTESELKPQPAIARPRRKLMNEALEEALQVYEIYPRKIGRPKALVSIARCIKTHNFQVVFDGTKLFSDLWKASGKEISFCPHPTTFFNGERFNDSPEAWGLATSKKIHAGPTYQEVLKYVTEKENDVTKRAVWSNSFFARWKKLEWKRDGKEIEWQIELQNQIGKWRAEPQKNMAMQKPDVGIPTLTK